MSNYLLTFNMFHKNTYLKSCCLSRSELRKNVIYCISVVLFPKSHNSKVPIIQTLLLDKYHLHILQTAKLRQKEAETVVLERSVFILSLHSVNIPLNFCSFPLHMEKKVHVSKVTNLA